VRQTSRSASNRAAIPIEADDYVSAFVRQTLRTGLMLQRVLSDLLEGLPEDAFPGEDSAAVLIEMLTGTIRPVAEAAGGRTVAETTALLDACGEKVLADLRGALTIRVAMDRGRPQG